MTGNVLTRDEAFRRIRKAETRIRSLGVRRLALFGSVVRDEARLDSDVDVLVEFHAEQRSFDRFIELAEFLESLLGRPVELVTVDALSPILAPFVRAEAQDVLRAA